MRIERLIEAPTARRLILCFSGWAASPDLFRRLQADAGWAVWVVYDYRSLAAPFLRELALFEEVRVVAWSLGVWVAEQLLPGLTPPGGAQIGWQAVAVNGTGRPIDDRLGIPEAVFRGTLEQLDADNLARFNRRMCGSKAAWDAYRQLPARPLEEVREELQALYTSITHTPPAEAPALPWQCARLSTADRIFPIENLRAWWTDRCKIITADAPHAPFALWNQWSELWES